MMTCRYVNTYKRTFSKEDGKTHSRAPKIQRLITPQRLQRKRRANALKTQRIQRVSWVAAEPFCRFQMLCSLWLPPCCTSDIRELYKTKQWCTACILGCCCSHASVLACRKRMRLQSTTRS